MARTTPQEFAAKWAQRTSAASADYSAGIRRVQTAPGAQAAAKRDTWRQRTMDATDKWASKVGAVPLAEWQNMAATKGAQNLSTGVNAAQAKMAAAGAKLLADVDNSVAKIAGMPNATFEQRKARATAYMDAMHAASRVGGR